MVRNFLNMGIPLYSIDDFNSIENIKENYEKRNFNCEIYSLKDIYWKIINR